MISLSVILRMRRELKYDAPAFRRLPQLRACKAADRILSKTLMSHKSQCRKLCQSCSRTTRALLMADTSRLCHPPTLLVRPYRTEPVTTATDSRIAMAILFPASDSPSSQSLTQLAATKAPSVRAAAPNLARMTHSRCSRSFCADQTHTLKHRASSVIIIILVLLLMEIKTSTTSCRPPKSLIAIAKTGSLAPS